jgi:hypothetical protein
LRRVLLLQFLVRYKQIRKLTKSSEEERVCRWEGDFSIDACEVDLVSEGSLFELGFVAALI